jgi:germination protein M
MFRNRIRFLLALVAVPLLLFAVACGDDDDAATPTPTEPTPTGEPAETPTPGATATATAQSSPTSEPSTIELNVYFMRGEGVATVLRELPETEGVARAAIEALLEGPTGDEIETGLTTAIPEGTELLDIAIEDRVAIVDLSGEFESGGGTLSMQSRLAQVVYTLTQFPTVDGVQFRLDGVETDTFGGEGLTIDTPADRSDFEDVTPAIFVESPPQGATVSSPLRVTGTANTFEAVFQLNVVDNSGLILYDEPVMATSGTGTRGTFDVTVEFDLERAGAGSIIVFELSAQDGSQINVVEVPVTFE